MGRQRSIAVVTRHGLSYAFLFQNTTDPNADAEARDQTTPQLGKNVRKSTN